MSASRSDVGGGLVGSCSFWLRSVNVALLNVPSLVIVEITHALGWGVLLLRGWRPRGEPQGDLTWDSGSRGRLCPCVPVRPEQCDLSIGSYHQWTGSSEVCWTANDWDLANERTGRGPCFSDSTANIVQRQIASALLSRTSKDVIMVFQGCLAARTEPDRGIGGLSELLGVGWFCHQSWMNLIRREAPCFEDFQVAWVSERPHAQRYHESETRQWLVFGPLKYSAW